MKFTKTTKQTEKHTVELDHADIEQALLEWASTTVERNTHGIGPDKSFINLEGGDRLCSAHITLEWSTEDVEY